MKLQKIAGALILAGLLVPALAGAQFGGGTPAPGTLQTVPTYNLDVNFFLAILNRLVQWVFSIFLIIAVLMLIIAAFKYLTSGGDSARVSEATRAVVFAVVAIAVALVAASVRTLVESLIGAGGGGNPFG